MPKPCPICGSTRWRRDNISGSAICEDGHVFQDFRSENLVVENSAYALQRRSLKKAPRRNRRRERGDVNRDHYRGDDADYLKLQALQLLLRLQIQALSKLWSLPNAFESIVRDLWAYHLASVQLPPLPDLDTPPNEQKGGPVQNDDDVEAASDDDEHKSVHSEASQESGESDLSTPDDAALEEELLAQLSPNTSDDEELQQVQAESSSAQDVSWRRRRRIQITDTLVTIVVALWVLRIPVLNVDLERLVNDNRLPFLDFGQTTHVPAEMKKHMDRKLVQALSPRRAPRPEFLHEQCTSLVRVLSRHFRLVIPESNIAPTAWRIISKLGGTPTTYAQTMRLLALLDVNLTLTTTHVEAVSRKVSRRRSTKSPSRVPAGPPEEKAIERTSRYEDVWLPEVSVAAALIMVMKMAYGLDGIERPALTWSDPVIGLPRSDQWIRELSDRLEADTFGTRFQRNKQDFSSMDLDDIDKYLDLCERVLMKDHDPGHDTSFPLDDTLSEEGLSEPLKPQSIYAHWTKADLVQPSNKSLNVPNKELPPLPGERIRVFESTDLTGTLPKGYDTLLKSCAAAVGVEEKHLARCVEVYETRLEKIRLNRGELKRESSGSRSASRTNSGRGRTRRPRSMGNMREPGGTGGLTPPATS